MDKEQLNTKVQNNEPVQIKDLPQDTVITPEVLDSIVQKNVKTELSSQLDELKKGLNSHARKTLFDGEDDEDNQIGQSVIDTSYFSKNYLVGGQHNEKEDGVMLANQMVKSGGPWKKLSPVMEKFATMVKFGFDMGKIMAAGINLKEYNDEAIAGYKALGMSEGVSADGGATVPVEYASTIIEFAVKQSEIISRVFRYPMISNSLKIPKLTQTAGSYFGGITLYWPEEAEEKTSSKPVFEQLSFTARKMVGLVYLTDELIADSAISILNYTTGLFTRAFQYETERMILDGSGVGQPLGIINDPTINIVQRNNEGTINFTDITNLEGSLDENFNKLLWVTRRVTFTTLRNIRDNNNALIFTEGYHATLGNTSVPPRVSGWPVVVTRNVPRIGNQGDIILGDFQHYILATRQSITVDTSIHVAFTTDETVVRFVARMDGKPGVSIAFSILNEMGS